MIALLAQIAAAGWLVNNLYQRHDRTWCANLRRPEEPGQDFGRGATPEAALTDCIAKMGGLPDDDLDAMLA